MLHLWKTHIVTGFLFLATLTIAAPFAAWAQSAADIDALNKQVIQLYSQGKYVEASTIAQQALVLAESVLGTEHPSTLRSVDSLALLYSAWRRYGEAEQLYRRALASREKALGRDHPDVAHSLSLLAALDASQGRYAEAEALHKRALAIREKALGRDHPDVGQTLIDIAEVYSREGRYGEAEPLYKRAHAVREKALGPDHPNAGQALNGLALLYTQEGRYAEAEPLYKRTLEVSARLIGKEHPQTRESINNLVHLYNAQGKSLEELKLYLSAQGISISNVCAEKNICTPVRIFFGTDRMMDATLDAGAKFGAERSAKLLLGQAVVTVPRAGDRRRGEIRRPTWWERNVLQVPAEGDPAKHFTILKDGFAIFSSPDTFLAAVREHMRDAGDYKEHAFVFVHGYNTAFDAALYRTAQIAYDLGYDEPGGLHIPFGTAFLFSWPSAGDPKGYLYDQDSARLAVDHLKDFLVLVASKSGAKQIHVIAHSMGNVTLLNALNDLSKAPPKGVMVNQIVLAAPDLDVGEFEKLAQTVTSLAKGVTLYASSKDLAMIAAREIRKGAPRAGDVFTDGPIVMNKIYSIDISAINTDIFSTKHSEYSDNKVLLNDINHIFSKGEQPPHARNINFSRRKKGKLEYWRYAE